MARSLGIHLRPDGFSFALVEGSARKHSLKACGEGGLQGEGPPARLLGRALGRALKEAGSGKVDQVVLSLPSAGTVLRELSLPFNDREKVRQVLKFEIESDLYHLDIDEVVCDFLELEDERATATLLVAAVPKTDLEAALAAAEAAGLDPPVFDLDLGSLADFLLAREQPAAGEEAPEGLRAALYLGSAASLLLVLTPSGLRAARVIHLGWRELARGLEAEEAEARAAVPAEEAVAEDAPTSSEAEGGTGSGDAPSLLEEEASGEGEAGEEEAGEGEEDDGAPLFGTDPTLPLHVSWEVVQESAPAEQRAAFLKRLAAEVRRGLAAVAGQPLAELLVLGAPLEGLAETLEERLGVPARRVAVPAPPAAVPGEGEEGEAGEAPSAADPVALGAALRGLGAGFSAMNFRQEEYRYTRGWEKIEGAFSFMLVGLIAWFLVQTVVDFQLTKARRRDNENLLASAVAAVETYDQRIKEELSEDGYKKWFIRTDFSAQTGESPGARMRTLRSRVLRARDALEQALGEDTVMPETCLEAWRLLVAEVVAQMKDYPGRWMIENFDFTAIEGKEDKRSESGWRSEPHVRTRFRISILGDYGDASRQVDQLIRRLRQQSWVVNQDSEPVSNPQGVEPLEAGEGGSAEIHLQIRPSRMRGQP